MLHPSISLHVIHFILLLLSTLLSSPLHPPLRYLIHSPFLFRPHFIVALHSTISLHVIHFISPLALHSTLLTPPLSLVFHPHFIIALLPTISLSTSSTSSLLSPFHPSTASTLPSALIHILPHHTILITTLSPSTASIHLSTHHVSPLYTTPFSPPPLRSSPHPCLASPLVALTVSRVAVRGNGRSYVALMLMSIEFG